MDPAAVVVGAVADGVGVNLGLVSGILGTLGSFSGVDGFLGTAGGVPIGEA